MPTFAVIGLGKTVCFVFFVMQMLEFVVDWKVGQGRLPHILPCHYPPPTPTLPFQWKSEDFINSTQDMFECESQQRGNILLLIISASLEPLSFHRRCENGALLHGCNWPFMGQI